MLKLSPSRTSIIAWIIMALAATAPVHAQDLERSVGIYDGDEYVGLGTLDVYYELVGANHYVDGYFSNYTNKAIDLDTYGGWDFRWIVIEVSNEDGAYSSADGTPLSFPYVWPPSGGFAGDPNDSEPFFWSTVADFDENHTEGVDSYLGAIYKQEVGDSDQQFYLVLHNPAHPKTILLLDNGDFGITVGTTGHVGPYAVAGTNGGVISNAIAKAQTVKDALENAGFFDYIVLAVCDGCGFSFSIFD